MSRLAPLDRVLVPILVALWVVVFALGVRNQIRGGPGLFGLELSAGFYVEVDWNHNQGKN